MSSDPKGYVLLINNVDFHDHEDPRRAGSDKDAKDLEMVFSRVGFKVIQKRNLTGAVCVVVFFEFVSYNMAWKKYPDEMFKFHLQDMFATIRSFAQNKDHEAVDSCVLVILSHGDNGNILGK